MTVMAPDQESAAVEVQKPEVDSTYDIDELNVATMVPLKKEVLTENVNGVNDTCNNNQEEDILVPEVQINLPGQVRLEWVRVQKVGAGLANLGNTCFLNTVIQCLTYCPPLANYLLQENHSSSCKCYAFCMMCELQKHMKEAMQHSGDVIEPTHIYDNLKLIADHFQCGQQEDAHEFLRFVIENLWRASLYSYSNDENLDPAIRETTIINHIFGGYNRSQVVCLRCKKKSNRFEHFMDFILDIKYNASSLEKALEQFVKPEILEKENAYRCPRCDALVPAEKTSTIHKAPNVATIQLKRFDYHKSHGGKIMKHVTYPERLNLRPYMSEPSGSPLMYRLNAVLVHVGQNCNSGHYYCYIRNSNNFWYLMDDARVQKVGLHEVLNEQAYVLFYVRLPLPKKNGLVSSSVANFMKMNDGKQKSSPVHNGFLSSTKRQGMPRNRVASGSYHKWNSAYTPYHRQKFIPRNGFVSERRRNPCDRNSYRYCAPRRSSFPPRIDKYFYKLSDNSELNSQRDTDISPNKVNNADNWNSKSNNRTSVSFDGQNSNISDLSISTNSDKQMNVNSGFQCSTPLNRSSSSSPEHYSSDRYQDFSSPFSSNYSPCKYYSENNRSHQNSYKYYVNGVNNYCRDYSYSRQQGYGFQRSISDSNLPGSNYNRQGSYSPVGQYSPNHRDSSFGEHQYDWASDNNYYRRELQHSQRNYSGIRRNRESFAKNRFTHNNRHNFGKVDFCHSRYQPYYTDRRQAVSSDSF